MQGLEESLSEDQEMDEEPASSFCGSCDSSIETIEESWPDHQQQAESEITSLNEQTRLLKENLQKLEEEIVKTQVIVVLHIHVERAINKLK